MRARVLSKPRRQVMLRTPCFSGLSEMRKPESKGLAMWCGTRRDFLKAGGVAAVGLGSTAELLAQMAGERPAGTDGVEVLNPQARVPVSMIIDDSTCLVNLAHFGMPQFAAAWPGRESYKKPWRKTPREVCSSTVGIWGRPRSGG